jgi:hypothetical protein
MNINYIQKIQNNPVEKGYHWIESWLFSTNAKQIGMCAVWAILLSSSSIGTPYIFAIIGISIIYMPNTSVILKPKKISIMKAWCKNWHIVKLSNKVMSVIGRVYGYVKKFDYVLLTINEVIWYDNLDQMYPNAYKKDSGFISWQKGIWCFREKCRKWIITMEYNAQKPKDSRSLNQYTKYIEPRQVIAYDKNVMRAGRDHSTEESNELQGKGPNNDEKEVKPEMVKRWITYELTKYKENKDDEYKGIIRIIGNPNYLKMCYMLIKSQIKNKEKENIDNITEKTLIEMGKSIINGSLNMKLNRKHPNRIWNLKIIEKALQIILECIYEPTFRNSSYGFRPKRSKHTALYNIYLKGHHYTWVIQGNICLENKKILEILKKKIKCEKFWILVKKWIINKQKETTVISNKSIWSLSPLLMNIVLDQLDGYIEDVLIPKYNMSIDKKIFKKRNDRNSMYVRYANDFVYLYKGTKKEALDIKEQISNNLTKYCGLELNEKKTVVSNISEGFYFLDAEIYKQKYKNVLKFNTNLHLEMSEIRLNIPIDKLISNLIIEKIVRRNNQNKIYPIPCNRVILLDHYSLIQFFAMKWYGIKGFYTFAANKYKLSDCYWWLKSSLAKTLAKKYKLRSQREAFKKFGKLLKDPKTGETFPIKGKLIVNEWNNNEKEK